MNEFIEIVQEGGVTITLSKNHIVYIEPADNSKTKIITDLKTSITDSKMFIANEPYSGFIKRLES